MRRVGGEWPSGLRRCNNSKDKLFLQGGDPLQNSRMGNNAMYKVGLKKFSIPAWSPDMNPSENVFNYVSTKLYEESLNRNMNLENFIQRIFCLC